MALYSGSVVHCESDTRPVLRPSLGDSSLTCSLFVSPQGLVCGTVCAPGEFPSNETRGTQCCCELHQRTCDVRQSTDAQGAKSAEQESKGSSSAPDCSKSVQASPRSRQPFQLVSGNRRNAAALPTCSIAASSRELSRGLPPDAAREGLQVVAGAPDVTEQLQCSAGSEE